MKKVFFILLFIQISFSSCIENNSPTDFAPVIDGQFKDNKVVFYPSTDNKISAIVVDKNGDVWYLRLNGFGALKDNKKLFNVNDYK